MTALPYPCRWYVGSVETASMYAVFNSGWPSGWTQRVVTTAWLTSSAPRYAMKCRPPDGIWVKRFRNSTLSWAAMHTSITVDRRVAVRASVVRTVTRMVFSGSGMLASLSTAVQERTALAWSDKLCDGS